jgi:hypothetical protein
MILSYLVLAIVWVFFVAGLGFEGRVLIVNDDESIVFGRQIIRRFVRPFWYFWLILAGAVLLGPFFLQSYYDYYAASINSQFLASISLNSFFAFAIMLFLMFPGFGFNDKNFWIPIFCCAIFLCLLALFLMLPQSSRYLQALIAGPSHNNGVVEEKFWNRNNYYYIDVDGESFWTPDGNWYGEIQIGSKLEFAASPFTDLIFDPQNIGFSILGIVIVLCGYAFWFLGVCLAIDGWLSVVSRRREKPM